MTTAPETGSSLQPVPLMAPLRAFQEQQAEILAAVNETLGSGMWVYGARGKALEAQIGEFLGNGKPTPCAVVSSGTDALLLALQALGVESGDEVITPALSFFASASVVSLSDAKPMFCDVDIRTFAVDPACVERAITTRTAGIIAVHLYGLPAEVHRLREIADRHRIFLLEDVCQAIGARVDGQAAGTFGDLSAFSFYPTKNLGACGEGGAVSGMDLHALEIVSKLRAHGETSRYHHNLLGRNCRLDEIQSAILSVRLKKLDEWTKRRQEIAARYTDAWADLPLRVPYVPDGYEHVYHLYVVQTRDRERLREFLSSRGIGSGVYYPVALPALEIFRGLGHCAGDFPVSEQLCREVLALPMFPQMTDDEVERVIESVLEFFGYKT